MNADKDKDLELIQKALDTLGEHFDSVHVFATRHDAEGTVNVNRGLGNWFARYGQVREWIVKEEQSSRNDVPRKDTDE